MKIKPLDISVIIQGSISEYTTKCLKSVRKHLPGAEIILSTWIGSDVLGLDYDVLVLSKDPGGYKFLTSGDKLNNINRIIVSSKSGLEKATRKYTLLMRNDLVLYNDNVLKLQDIYKRNSEYALFKHRIFSYELYSVKSERKEGHIYQSIFHISDWCRFGLTPDLQELFNIKTVKEPNFSRYKLNHKIDVSQDVFPFRTWKMSPEQYITSENTKKVVPTLNIKSCLDWREEVLRASDEFIVNNFIVKSVDDWGIKILKQEYRGRRINTFEPCRQGAYLGKNWLLDYKKYCDPDFVIPFRYRWTQELRIDRYITHLQVHIQSLLKPIKIFFHWFDNIFSIVYYIVKIIFKAIYWAPYVVYKQIKNNR